MERKPFTFSIGPLSDYLRSSDFMERLPVLAGSYEILAVPSVNEKENRVDVVAYSVFHEKSHVEALKKDIEQQLSKYGRIKSLFHTKEIELF
jgi:hypothetical protein